MFGLNKSRKYTDDANYITAISSYRHLARAKYNVLKTIFGYGKSGYIIPNESFCLDYVNLQKKLQYLIEDHNLKDVPTFEYKEYVNLELNSDFMIQKWSKIEVVILQDLAELEALYLQKTNGIMKPFDNVIVWIEDLEEDIAEYKKELNKKRGLGDISPLPDSSHWDENNPMIFWIDKRYKLVFHGNSNLRKQFKMIASKNGDYELAMNIKGKLKISDEAMRSSMTDLRDMIEKQGLQHVISIDASGKGSYKLTYLLPNTD